MFRKAGAGGGAKAHVLPDRRSGDNPVTEPIPIAGPWITQKEIDYVTDAVRHAWYASANQYHERFERRAA